MMMCESRARTEEQEVERGLGGWPLNFLFFLFLSVRQNMGKHAALRGTAGRDEGFSFN